MNLTPQPSATLQDARAKQLTARRKMQNLPSQTAKATDHINIDWHNHYLLRVSKAGGQAAQ